MRSLALWVVLVTLPLLVLAQSNKTDTLGERPEELILQISVNELAPIEDAQVVLREKGNTLLLSSEGLSSLRIRKPASPDQVLDGTNYYRLNNIAGVTWTLDESTLSLAMKVPAEAFEASSYTTTNNQKNEAVRPAWSALLSYDLLAQHSAGVTQEAGSLATGVSGPYGVVTTNWVARKTTQASEVVRLDSSWTYDLPTHIATLKFGDGISRSGAGWGQSVRFGGIQYATNFATQPGMVLLPQQTISGSAVIPSTVDVFINNSLVSRQPVPAGPFSIKDIPIMAGPGQMQVIVRDQLGREQVMTSSFFGSSFLIKPGLNDYSFEVGALRNNFGSKENNYGDRFAEGTWRRGITSWLTTELHGEFSQHGDHAIGIGTALPLGQHGTINTTLAGSSSNRGNGVLVGLDLSQDFKVLSISLSAKHTSQAFWQIGFDTTDRMPKLVASASAGVSLLHGASLGLGYFHQDYWTIEQSALRLATASLSFQLPFSIYAGLNANKSLTEEKSLSVGMFISIPLGSQAGASISVQRSSGSELTGNASFQKSLPIGQGLGYQLQAQHDGNLSASGSYQNNVGTYTAQVVKQQGEFSEQATMRGSLLAVGGRLLASRAANDASYALVRMPGFANVRIYNGNQLVGQTDKNGYAIIPGLLPYQPNSLSIEEQDLPLDAQVKDLKKIATPWFRSAVVVEFPVTRFLSAEMRVVDGNGKPIPAGANARLASTKEEFTFAENGRLYLSGISTHNQVLIEADELRCMVEFSFSPSNDPLQDLGTLICKGDKP